MEMNGKYRPPSATEIEAAEAWLDEHYRVGSAPERIAIRGDAPEGFAFAVAAAIARRRDRASVGWSGMDTLH